ncbi:hypothetical protein UlMin_042873 [Ulmus minor]
MAVEEVILRILGTILNLIDKHYSVELACGDFTMIRLRQGENVVAVLARIAEEIQWPLARDKATVKLDNLHYFFSFQTPKEHGAGLDSRDEEDDRDNLLNYGLTIASKGQERLVKELDGILQSYSSFMVQKMVEKAKKGDALDGSTTLAPNIEDYSGIAVKMIVAGLGELIKGILWCGDVTKKRMSLGSEKEVNKETLKKKEEKKKGKRKRKKKNKKEKRGRGFCLIFTAELIVATRSLNFSKICNLVQKKKFLFYFSFTFILCTTRKEKRKEKKKKKEKKKTA